jgi:hypothetical protein
MRQSAVAGNGEGIKRKRNGRHESPLSPMCPERTLMNLAIPTGFEPVTIGLEGRPKAIIFKGSSDFGVPEQTGT